MASVRLKKQMEGKYYEGLQDFFKYYYCRVIEEVQISRIHHSRIPLRREEDDIFLEELKTLIDQKWLLQPIIVRVDDNGAPPNPLNTLRGQRVLTYNKPSSL